MRRARRLVIAAGARVVGRESLAHGRGCAVADRRAVGDGIPVVLHVFRSDGTLVAGDYAQEVIVLASRVRIVA